VKSLDTARAEATKHLAAGWHVDVTGAGGSRWPKTIPLGTFNSADADARYAEVRDWSHAWHTWVRSQDVTLRTTTRRIRGIDHSDVPTHLVLEGPDQTAAAVADGWPARLHLARSRAKLIEARLPGADVAVALRLADHLDDVDFELALTAARWLADSPGAWVGLTPRQIPVAGLHAKWLDRNKPLVKALARIDDLTLAERGTRVYWTYLDPGYRRTGGRLHDSLTLGDNVPLPYDPALVLIVENKDTAVLFPDLAGAIVVEGNGNASVGLLHRVPWIASAHRVIYWGDIDARGYEILSGLRERLPQVRSVLMDRQTYEQFEDFGTNVDERGVLLNPRKRNALPNLSAPEREMYLNVTDPNWTRHRRLEQERIPLATGVEQVLAAVTGLPDLSSSARPDGQQRPTCQ
jgi:hypothetical protein